MNEKKYIKQCEKLLEKYSNVNISGYKTGLGNAYSSRRYIYTVLNVANDKNPILVEKIDYEVPQDMLGGIIVISTDVNTNEQNKNKLLNWISQKIKTFKNRIAYSKKTNDRLKGDEKIGGWTIGRFLRGRYVGKNGQVFDENSFSIEIVGVDFKTLLDIAEDLCKSFDQETVLVKTYNPQRVLFVNSEKEINNKKESINEEDSLDIDFDDDDFDNYIEDEPPTEEQIKFSKEIKDLFQSIIDAEEDEDVIEENFVSNNSLLRHFKKHCLGKSLVKKSTDDSIYYDFTNINQFSNYEQVITKKFQSNDVLIPDDMYNVKSVNDNFRKLFEGDKCFLFGPEWGFTNKNGNIRVGVYAYSSNVTTNYGGDNTVDIYISTSSPKTITLYPINASRLKDKLVTILIKYSNSNVVIDNDNENNFVK